MFGLARYLCARDGTRLSPWVYAAGCAVLLHGWALIDRSGPARGAESAQARPMQGVVAPVAVVDLVAAHGKPNPSTPAQALPSPAARPEARPRTPAPLPAFLPAQKQPDTAGGPVQEAAAERTLRTPRADPLDAAPDEPDLQSPVSVDAQRVRQVPVYAAQLPGEFVLPLQARRWNPASALGEPPPAAPGAGELRFERGEQGHYALSLNLQLGPRPLLEMHSRGRAGSVGLEPERFTDRRRGRSSSAANLDRETQQARFSVGTAPVPLAVAAQDRLTWLVQLPAVLRADPSLLRQGAVVWLQVVGARGGSQVWRFEALGPETLRRLDGTVLQSAWRWQRQPESPYDLQVDVWFTDPVEQVPALVRLTPVPGGAALEFWPGN